MNQYYKCLNFIRESLRNAPLVNTITQGVSMDTEKKTIYPLAHVNVLSSRIGQDVIFVFEIHALDVRNISKIKSKDKFIGNDNEIDNLNTCHAILNYMITKIQLQRNEDDIEIVEISDLMPGIMLDTNMLDGWKIEITLSIPNNEMTVCCED